MLLQQFQDFILRENLFKPTDTVLLALSAGIDSVTMCELFYQSGYKFAIAHCNFGLRGDESDSDERFVAELGKKYHAAVFCKHFKTQMEIETNSVSTQMAARKLRYQWFFELAEKERFHYVATAHHLDDQTETFFINILRGSGLSGLHGIFPKKGKLIRPLLFCERSDIDRFASENSLQWREDSSNATDKYLRNKLRHHLLPVLKELDEGFSKKLGNTLRRIQQSEKIYQIALDEKRAQLIAIDNNIVKINIQKLRELSPIETVTFEILREWDFRFEVCQEIVQALQGISGKRFLSHTHQLLVDRDFLLISAITEKTENTSVFWIEKTALSIESPVSLKFSTIPASQIRISKNKNMALIDLDKLKFPLLLRKWESGDWFIPFGMKGKKKLSDFFIDQKLSLLEKGNTWILCSENQIVWVVGMRLDNRFKVSAKTQQVFLVDTRERLPV